ncbi:MAG: glycoside hydrolase family 18 protein, partial [Ignavibacteriaceae bacterium]|nr:glycoside hydrolase family 18 protein [Ignavibacteriaceae bacterium]
MKKLLFGLRIFLINVDLKIISIFIIGFLIFPQYTYAQKKVVGYYESWFTDYSADKIEYNNLTHIINSFAQPNSDGSINMPYGIPNSYLVTLSHRNNKKLLISFNNETNSFDTVTADTTLRAKFIDNVVKFLTTYHYDGIDIDWEFPDAAQGKNLTLLVQQMRKKFQETDTTWLITMAVPAGSWYGQYYQYEKMVSYVDWFAVMTYYFHGSWSSQTGHNAPLYGSSKDNEGDDSSSVVYMTSTRKVPASKLLLGLPFYGIEFFKTKGLYQSFDTSNVPEINYADLMDTISNGKWIYHWDNTSKVPYYTDSSSTKFITIDDTMSIRLKTQFS